MKRIKLLLVSLVLYGFNSYGQLAAGDIAFIGMNTDATEGYSFIALTDIPGNEVIFFSDRGIISSSAYIVGVEGTYKFTAPAAGIPCGTIVAFNETSPDTYTISGVAGATMTLEAGSANLGSGDQVYAYQTVGDVISSVPSDATFIAGIMCDYDAICVDATTKWTQSSCVSSTSESIVPPGLTNGTNCVSITPAGPEKDNMRYTGTLTGTSTFLRGQINDFTNWETNNSPAYNITSGGYAAPSVTCVAACTDPDIPTITFSPSTVCAGSDVTLTISGSLNDATAWHVYTGSCGGTADGTTASATYTASPSAPSTTYFVRGEGGCVTPGSCGSVTINVTAIDDAGFSYDAASYCPNATDPSPTISGAMGGTFTSSPAGLDIASGTGLIDLSESTQGTYTVTYTTSGACPNTSNVTVSVIDNTDPTPSAASLPNVTAQCQVTTLTPPSATDNCGGTVTVTHDATLPITTQGTTTVTWTYDDGNGNTTTQTQNVVIDDTTDPTPSAASLPNVTAQCQVTTLTPPSATDNCGGTVTVTHDATLPITTQGTTLVTWTYDDGNGNTTTQTQNVVIDDTTDPTPSAASLPNVTAQCQVTTLTPPSATDNCGGTVTVTHDATLPITTQGTTTVTWTYDDGNGNTTTQTQNVVIDDTTDPTPSVASLPNVTAQCQVTTLTPPSATDNCGGTVTVTHDATLPITTQGTTVVTWTYDDGNGNTTTQTQNVVIDDTTDPTPSAASLPNITAECEVTTLTAPTGTDNCGGAVTVTHDATLPITAQGTTVVTWTFDDGNGNTTTQMQNVILNDSTDPTPSAASLPNVTAQCQVATLTAPSATDNCGGTVTVTHDATLPITTQGTTVVTWTFDDGNGNTITQTQNVVIDDTTDPTPSAASLPNVTAQCQVTALTPPSATDNCGGTVTITHDATLPITTQGTTVVTWTYDDGNGNTTTQTQNVVIDDTNGPTPDVAVLPNVTAECEVTTLTPPTATDNCGGIVSVTNDATLPITTQGTTVVTWTYQDENDNTTTQTQNVVIDDVTGPAPDAATLPNITAECEVTTLSAPTATDNCGGTVTVTHDATLPITTQGTTVVTWTYEDENDNTSTQTQNVVIDDVTEPTPDAAALADITAECEVTTLSVPTATDNCGGTVTVTHDATLPITAQGTTVVTWTYDDGNGNTTTQTQNVVIDDVTEPTPDLAELADVTAECEVTTLSAPSATDNCGGTVTVTHDATLPITIQGTTVVTWTYDDGNGNTTTQTQNVVIDDVTEPTPDAAALADVTAECEVTALSAPSATDNCGGTVTVSHDATLPITTQGTTIVTWTYEDENGNTTTQAQNVIIDDTTDPTPDAAVLADITAECEVTSLTTPSATDNCGGIVTVSNDASFPITEQGVTTVTWTYDDGNGNTATQTQNVIIDDVTDPTPDLAELADITAECEVTALTDPTATDNCGGTVTVTHDATLPITTQGTTVVTWTYDDGNGNTVAQTQNVVIDDVTEPTPDLAELADITAECEVAELTSPTGTDNCGGIVTVTHDADLPITTQGTTVVTWTYDDGNGNTTTQAQNVVIDDVTEPTPDAEELADITAECEVTELTAPTATDNCGGAVTVTHDADLPITTQGTTVVTWTYDDGNGNTTTQAQNVVIDDVTEPTPDLAELADITAECEVAELTPPTGTDNCGGIVTVTHDVDLPIITQGTTVVTWTYDDGNGNTVTQMQNVVIDDITAPEADEETLDVLEVTCALTSLTSPPTATDNCGATITATTETELPITENTTITWIYDDGNGNTSTQTQDVIILPIDVTTTVEAGGVTVTANYADADSYQWIDCNNGDEPIDGATEQSYTATENGSYAVIITRETCADTSECVTITAVGLTEHEKIDLIIYPNPVRENFFRIQSPVDLEMVWITDLQGRTIASEFNAANLTVTLSDTERGNYIVHVLTTAGHYETRSLILLQ